MPVMKHVLQMPDIFASMPDLKTPQPEPGLPWAQARFAAREAVSRLAPTCGFRIEHEAGLQYSPEKGVFIYAVRSDRDIIHEGGGTIAIIDGQTGALRDLILPTGQHATLSLHNWMFALHTASVWGMPYRIFLGFTGLVIAMLSITGVYLWWKKRKARIQTRAHRQERLVAAHSSGGPRTVTEEIR
jgi:uncharacterized iron-regulated membrane protein